MADVDSEPEMPPDFDSLPSSSDSDEESDDGQCSCPECPPESSDNEDIPREKNGYYWYQRRLGDTDNMNPTQFKKNFGMDEVSYNILFEEIQNDLPQGRINRATTTDIGRT